MSLKMASLNEKKSIYEIFRSCRLCGAGGGYKMPIIQNVVDLDDTDIELSQKIKECVQIEVAIDDKMPPLICELCIDKINDYHAFLTLCRSTHNKTRVRLGLPPLNRSSSPVEESILGVTEALCERDSSDNETNLPNSRASKPTKSKSNHKAKKPAKAIDSELTPSIKSSRRSSPPPAKPTPPGRREAQPLRERRQSSRPLKELSSDSNQRASRPLKNGGPKIKSRIRFESSSSTSPPPVRITRTKTSEQLFDQLTRDGDSSAPQSREGSPMLVEKEKKPFSRPGPKSRQAASLSPKGKQTASQSPKVTLKNQPIKDTKKEKVEDEKPKIGKKRTLDRETTKPTVPTKKTKPTPKPKEEKKRESPKAAPKALAAPAEPSTCVICAETFASEAARRNHERTHVVTFTDPSLSCNACEAWFASLHEAASHHASHRRDPRPYNCTVCGFDYDTLTDYNVHLKKYSCRKIYEEPDVQCLVCWNDYPTQTSLEQHKCLGEAGRPGGKCSKCGELYALLKDLIDHESDCTEERRANLDPMILHKIKPTQVRVARCDKLLETSIGTRVDVTSVPNDYGIDPNCYYPFSRTQTRIKKELEPFEGMVKINEDVRKQFENCDNSDDDVSGGKSKSKPNAKKTDAVFDDLIDDQPAFSQSYNFDSLIDSLDDKNNDSGEESVIKDFGVSNNKVQNDDEKSVLKTDVTIKNEKSPIKNSSFDIESLIKVDNDTNAHDNDTITNDDEIKTEDKEDKDVEVSDTVIGPLDLDIPEQSENSHKSIENNENITIKESPSKSYSTTSEAIHSTDLNDSAKLPLKTESSEQNSENNLTINQSINQSSKVTDAKIDSDHVSVDSNGLSETIGDDKNVKEEVDKVTE